MTATGRRVTACCGSRPRHCGRVPVVVLLCAALAACAGSVHLQPAVESLPPLRLADGREVTVAEVDARAPTPDLLATDAAMRDFVARYTAGIPRDRRRIMALHAAVRGPASLGIEYDPAAEGTARDAFHSGSANCLSYATLFVALAREAGLDARYQWLQVRPRWKMNGERVLVQLHVNVLVGAGRRDRFMVDIDPVPTRDIAGTRAMSDLDARALYHANIAMRALAEEDREAAWLHSVRALRLSPDMPHLWVNLGATYRFSGQHRAAERSYLRALALDPGHDSAMNNLAVLYELEGRESERAYWSERVARYRDQNPYYHAWRGDRAVEERDWAGARAAYERALALSPGDSRLLYALGLAFYALDLPGEASDYVRRAIEHATLRSDIETYEVALRAIEEGRDVAGAALLAPG